MTAFCALLAFDVRLSFRRGADTMVVVGFFLLTVFLFSLAFRGDTALLARIAPGLVWVTALLAAMLALDRLFLADFEDGSLDQLLLSEIPLELVVLAKAAAHWITTGLPLIAAAPALALVLNMNGAGLAHLVLSLLLGTPTLTLIGTIGAALTLGARRGGVLISLLVLPLYIPVLIFGVAVVTTAIDGMDASVPIMALGGFLLGALALAPLASAAALRQAAR
ncbi:MAG: heme exporter protein CcmB [Alphaproteobacteria bacterium]|nr:heme exporter protein CcmB [Alphaproteobacteria bacterium]MCZ6849809.1 heme exporter protein CcmB [Alphaproteobacteria bacterium]